jgi:hypothetical protein
MDWRVRDGVLIWFVPEGLQWAETLATGTESAGGSSGGDVDAAVARGLAGVLDVSAARRPDPGRLQPGEEILRAVVAHTIRERMVAPLTLLGFLSWWSGDQAGAAVRITEALSLDASYRLALLLNEAMNAGLAPGWVRARAAKGHATGVDGNAPDRDCVEFGVRSRS